MTFSEYLTSRRFQIDDGNKVAIEKIEKHDYNKGLLIIGNIGTGKTKLFEYLQAYNKKIDTWKFDIITSRAIEKAFAVNGYKGIEIYSAHSEHQAYNLMIDDIGLESDMSKNYGNAIRPVTEILYDRYELYRRDMILTHATTNLTQNQLEQKYGERLYSRFKEMFQILGLTGGDRRGK